MILRGLPVSPGVSVGPVYRYERMEITVASGKIAAVDVAHKLEKYRQVVGRAEEELESLAARLAGAQPAQAGIFKAQIDILHDVVMREEIEEMVARQLDPPDKALNEVYRRYEKLIAAAKDPLIRERAADLADVRQRLLRIWSGAVKPDLAVLEQPVVLAARELFPSDTAAMEPAKILAIVTEQGGETSHSAILARAHGIPAILGLEDLMLAVQNGQTVIANAINGTLDTEPGRMALIEAEQAKKAFEAQKLARREYLEKPAVTADGVRVKVCLNVASDENMDALPLSAVDGAGLLRTEFLFMARSRLPGEEEQYRMYTRVANRFGGNPVTIRTLDIGADKHIAALPLPREENPALGLRALRLCFEHPAVFKTQLRALLRASGEENIQIMFPMVASLCDIARARGMLEEAMHELRLEGYAFNEQVPVGIMVEIPSIALVAGHAAKEVDFASIGTNDLCQYLFAADRTNAGVARYAQSFHPAMLRLIGEVADAFGALGKEVSVCGEMAADPLAAALFTGMGIRKLSMNAGSVAAVKHRLAGLDTARAKKVAAAARRLAGAAEVAELLEREL